MAAEDDCSWMLLPKSEDAWQTGFEKFIEDTFEGLYPGETAKCPCARCRCMAFRTKIEVQKHLLDRGFDKEFVKQKRNRHRAPEPGLVDDDRDFGEGEADDQVNVSNLLSSLISGAIHGEITTEEPNDSAKNFFKLMEEARKELYPGCKEATKVSFIVRIF